MTFHVCVLESDSTGRRYVGQTDDLQRRLGEHNNPSHSQAKFATKQAGPWRLIYHEVQPSRSDAMRRERWLKSGVGRAWLKEGLGRASPPEAD